MDTFDFCPERNVPENVPRDASATVMSLGGWQFSSRPTTPYQQKFKVTLHGLKWYLDHGSGLYDIVKDPLFNARRLEMFYESHELWKPFNFIHQHLSDRPIVVRFASPLTVPAGEMNSGGHIKALEVMLIHHNPGF